MSKGETSEALADFNQAIEINPYQFLALSYRGEFYLQQNKLDMAKADLEKSLKLVPNNSNALYQMSLVHGLEKEKIKAVESEIKSLKAAKETGMFGVPRLSQYAKFTFLKSEHAERILGNEIPASLKEDLNLSEEDIRVANKSDSIGNSHELTPRIRNFSN
jgi:tetratricopeptide (TPR) repeat protein